MYHAINKQDYKNILTGFSLVELLVAIAIIGIISVISVQGLYDIVSIRAKQQTIEDSSDSFRVISRLITKSVIEAERVSIPNSQEIRLVSDASCQTIKYNGTSSILYAKVSDPTCTPPILTEDDAITSGDFVITSFSLSPTGNSVDIILLEMTGHYKNSLGDHPIKYTTTISKRI